VHFPVAAVHAGSDVGAASRSAWVSGFDAVSISVASGFDAVSISVASGFDAASISVASGFDAVSGYALASGFDAVSRYALASGFDAASDCGAVSGFGTASDIDGCSALVATLFFQRLFRLFSESFGAEYNSEIEEEGRVAERRQFLEECHPQELQVSYLVCAVAVRETH